MFIGGVLAGALVLGPACGRSEPFQPAMAAIITPDQAPLIRAALASADSHGLGPISPGDSGPQGLRAAAIAYARALHGGRLAESDFPRDWALRPGAYDAAADFDAAAAAGRLQAWLDSLPPPDPRYGKLVEAYARYRALAANGGWKPLPPSGGKAETLMARLALEDPGLGADSAAHGEALTAAVSRAQSRYGLNVDGTVSPALIEALNVPAKDRVEQIRLNLERLRWMPRALAGDRIEVNIAAAGATAYESGAPALSMRVVVGKPSTPTPSFADNVEALVFNPPWNVPPEIAAREIWPKIRGVRGYRAREGYVVRAGGGLQQRPGPKSALGLVKFDIPDDFAVYLHDTPSRKLFAGETRWLSHGCVRLEKPQPLAAWVLHREADWPEARMQKAIDSHVTQRTPLSRPVPVYLVYWTAFVDGQGQVGFSPDPYGWDSKLRSMLG
jgi:murein L,D-transpeptidase YcbB/YkuD